MTLPNLTCLLLMASLATAVSPAADIGDPAAPLAIDTWLKGDAISLDDAKNRTVLVIEFWATWCPPCRTSIPHLTEVQQKYKDRGVVIIGVTSEPAVVAKPFVEKQGDAMSYRVAVDKENQTNRGYMEAFKQAGIPHAFIVDRAGKIAWHGHPMDGLDAAIEKTLGSDAVAKETRLETLMANYETYAADSALADGAKTAVTDFLALAEADVPRLTRFANRIFDRAGASSLDHESALRVARAAVKHSKGADADACEAFARAWAATGNRERALRYQRMAIRLTSAADSRAARESILREYESLPEAMQPANEEPSEPRSDG